ncbi:TAP domain-containing protein [Xylariales sp. AK1849]|nr:TAP domain-containing protein [Xylariales sp. AK1849]
MPPSGPRNQRSARNSGGNSKTGGRGINKRRAGGPARIDRDGDLDMDTPAVATNGAGRGSLRAKNNNVSVPTGPRHATRSTTAGARPPKASSRAEAMVKRIINNGTGDLSSRISAGIDPSGRQSRSSRPINATNSMMLKVAGLKNSRAAHNDGGGLKELLGFLERKAANAGKLNRTVRIKKSQIKGDSVYITASKEDAEEILKLNGWDFAGAKITIEPTEGGPDGPALSESSQAVKDQLVTFLGQRYDNSSKLLDFSNLGQDEGLNQMGVFAGETSPQKLFRALMAVCDTFFKNASAKRESIISISLAGNDIDDVIQIMSLAETLPDLVNLDLSRNQFKDLRGLRKWSHRFRHLQTLLLNDNPIEAADPKYKDEITKWYPKLINLSGTFVRTPEQVAAAERGPRVFPIPQCGADFRDINRVGEGFITEFIQMYDADRQSLAAKYYDEHSTFSFAVNTNAPHPPDMQPAPWGAYIKLSRNHAKITNAPSRYSRFFCGTGLIQGAWQKLPLTRHPDLATQFDKYIIDCHPICGLADPTDQSQAGVEGMIMTMHGEFEDQDPDTKNTAKRGFSRTFLLGPGAPGRNPIRVISDMLSLKAFSPLPTVIITATQVPIAPAPAPAPVLAPAPAPVPVPASNEDAQKQQMVLELCKQTGMTPDYSTMCLEVAIWDFNQALVTFNEKRAELPSEAFAVTM